MFAVWQQNISHIGVYGTGGFILQAVFFIIWPIQHNTAYSTPTFRDNHTTNVVPTHYIDVIMGAMTSQIIAPIMTHINYLLDRFSSGTDERQHHSCASLALVRGIHRWLVNSYHKRLVTRKLSPFYDDIMRTTLHMALFGAGYIQIATLEWHRLDIDPTLSRRIDV